MNTVKFQFELKYTYISTTMIAKNNGKHHVISVEVYKVLRSGR